MGFDLCEGPSSTGKKITYGSGTYSITTGIGGPTTMQTWTKNTTLVDQVFTMGLRDLGQGTENTVSGPYS